MALEKILERIVLKYFRRNLHPALVGIVDGSGNIRVTDAKRPGWVHVRLGPDGQQGQRTARNDAGIPLRFGAPVLVWEIEGVLAVYGPDPARWETYAGESGAGAVGSHNHRRRSKLEYLLEMLLLEAGHVQWAGTGFEVDIRPLFYPYAGVWKYYPGETFDLASFQTATADNWNWVKVGIDPDANAAVAVAGGDVGVEGALTLADLAAISFSDYIPLVGIKLAEADSSLQGKAARYHDIGFWRGRQFVYPEGVSGGQTVTGGTDAEDDLTFESTSDADKGVVAIEPNAGVDGPFVALGASALPTDVNLYLFGLNGAYQRSYATAGRAQTELRTIGAQITRFILQQEGIGRWEIGMAADSSGNLAITGDLNTGLYALTLTPDGNQRYRFGEGGKWVGSVSDVDDTAQELVADGTGDVADLLTYRAIVKPSTGTAVAVSGEIAPGNSANLYDVGSDVLTLAVAADGSVTVQRGGGTLTYNARLTLDWL